MDQNNDKKDNDQSKKPVGTPPAAYMNTRYEARAGDNRGNQGNRGRSNSDESSTPSSDSDSRG